MVRPGAQFEDLSEWFEVSADEVDLPLTVIIARRLFRILPGIRELDGQSPGLIQEDKP